MAVSVSLAGVTACCCFASLLAVAVVVLMAVGLGFVWNGMDGCTIAYEVKGKWLISVTREKERGEGYLDL